MTVRDASTIELVEPILAAVVDEAEVGTSSAAARLVENLAEAMPSLTERARDDCQELMREGYQRSLRDGQKWAAASLLSGYLLSLARDPRSWWPVNGQPSGLPSDVFIEALDAGVAEAQDLSPAIRDLWAGIRAFVDGNDIEAMSRFHTAGRHPDFPRLVKDSLRGASTCRPMPGHRQLLSGGHYRPEESITWLKRVPDAASGPAIVFSGDDVYWRAFSPIILDSIHKALSPAGVHVHFHVINPSSSSTTDVLPALESLARAAGVQLSVSAERAPDAQRSYFASARYFRALELLRGLDRDMLMLDMDLEFTDPPDQLLSQLPSASVTQLVSTGPYWGFVPWRVYWAGLLYLPNDGPGAAFAELLSEACGYLWGPTEGLRWWTDQTALYVAHRAARLGGLDRRTNLVTRTPSGFRSSEKLKIEGLRRLDDIRVAMDEGQGWHAALEDAQK